MIQVSQQRWRKRPDGLSLVPWHSGGSAAWDVTVVHTLAASYVAQSAVQAGKAAEIAAERKSAKYSGLSSSHIFIPVAVESLDSLADDAHCFITEIGRRITFSTADPREKRRSCTSASQWRFNATMPCVLQHFHFRSVVVIPDIIIIFVIIVVIIIIIILIIIIIHTFLYRHKVETSDV